MLKYKNVTLFSIILLVALAGANSASAYHQIYVKGFCDSDNKVEGSTYVNSTENYDQAKEWIRNNQHLIGTKMDDQTGRCEAVKVPE